MLTPLQQTPIPLDPVRQQITPIPPIAPLPPARPADLPIQANETAQDKFDRNSSADSGRQDQALEDQQRAETASKLRTAYLRLNELQREASAAVAAGDASLARELAGEAANVAQTIPANVGFIETAAQQIKAQGTSKAEVEDLVNVPAALDLARAGLGTAKDVVDTVASAPQHPLPDRIAIVDMRHQVLDAMASVEEIATRYADSQTSAPDNAVHVDLNA